ncbi:MAG TPA: GatB/YqeY domain-containing protein [Anaerolineales bacterium]|nr:GatB/YqeY domain-containing protein [Anaerolineales bacterium]
MNLKEKITEEVKDAMRSGNEIKKRTLRMTQAAIKQIEVDKRIELDDEGVMAVLQKEIKIRKEAVEESKSAGREDLSAAAEAEIEVLKAFLPEELSPDALRELAGLVIADLKANSMADMGKVIKELMPKVAGRASGADVSAMVRSLLQ